MGARGTPFAPLAVVFSVAAACLLTLGAALAGGCGEDNDENRQLRSAVIGLDFTPNAVHAPIYTAVRIGYDRRHGVRLRIRPPGSSPDSLRLLASGIIAQADVHRPRELEGRTVGVSGLPSDPAVLRAVVEGDGGDYGKIGFAAVPNLIQKKIDAVPAFWNAEGDPAPAGRSDSRIPG